MPVSVHRDLQTGPSCKSLDGFGGTRASIPARDRAAACRLRVNLDQLTMSVTCPLCPQLLPNPRRPWTDESGRPLLHHHVIEGVQREDPEGPFRIGRIR